MLAYFISWTCYGTRLHGDERGTVDRQHNRVGTPFLRPSPVRQEAAAKIMRWDAITLSNQMRDVVRCTIEDHCRIRGWNILALHVGVTHIHIVVAAADITPEAVMEQFKSWATRRLREAGLVDRVRKMWTEHGSTIWVHDEDGLRETVNYVLNRQ